MTTEQRNNILLEEFRDYLEHNRNEDWAGSGHPDLHSLLTEMAALKTEVKTESRQFKNTLDILTNTVDTLQQDNETLSSELKRHDQLLAQQRFDITRTLMLDLVDIYERLATSLKVLDSYRPVNALFNHSKKRDVHFIQSIQEGQSITLNRFEQFLQQYGVRAINCIDHPLDPNTMKAVAIGHDPKQQNGIVLEELRRGFLFENQVLRLAEVRVNKTHSPLKTL